VYKERLKNQLEKEIWGRGPGPHTLLASRLCLTMNTLYTLKVRCETLMV
jgi:hypothetical protein